MVATAGLEEAVAVLAALRAGVTHLDAVELILPEAMELVAAQLGAAPPVGPDGVGAYVVVECADHEDPTDELTTALAERPEILDAAITTEGPARDRLVAFRDRITESIAAQGVPLKLDVAVPVARLAELLVAARRAVARHGGRLVPFGHLAEGNVHLNVLDPGDPQRSPTRCSPRRPTSAARSPPSTASASPRRATSTSSAALPSSPRPPP